MKNTSVENLMTCKYAYHIKMKILFILYTQFIIFYQNKFLMQRCRRLADRSSPGRYGF